MPYKNYKYIIIGAGLAGVSAAEAIRQRDSNGSILLARVSGDEGTKTGAAGRAPGAVSVPRSELHRAVEAFRGYKRSMREDAFPKAGEHLKTVDNILEQLGEVLDGGVKEVGTTVD